MAKIGPFVPPGGSSGGPDDNNRINKEKFKQKMKQVEAVEKTDPDQKAKKRKPSKEEDQLLDSSSQMQSSAPPSSGSSLYDTSQSSSSSQAPLSSAPPSEPSYSPQGPVSSDAPYSSDQNDGMNDLDDLQNDPFDPDYPIDLTTDNQNQNQDVSQIQKKEKQDVTSAKKHAHKKEKKDVKKDEMKMSLEQKKSIPLGTKKPYTIAQPHAERPQTSTSEKKSLTQQNQPSSSNSFQQEPQTLKKGPLDQSSPFWQKVSQETVFETPEEQKQASSFSAAPQEEPKQYLTPTPKQPMPERPLESENIPSYTQSVSSQPSSKKPLTNKQVQKPSHTVPSVRNQVPEKEKKLDLDKKKQPQQEDTTTQGIQAVQAPVVNPISSAPPIPEPAAPASYLSKEVHELFQTMVGLVMIQQITHEGLKGTQTEISLNNPEYEQSKFYGLKIVITEYETAPGSYNIELQGDDTQNNILAAQSEKLISAFNDNRYNLPFTINRLDISLKKGESDFLFKRKESVKGDQKGFGDRHNR